MLLVTQMSPIFVGCSSHITTDLKDHIQLQPPLAGRVCHLCWLQSFTEFALSVEKIRAASLMNFSLHLLPYTEENLHNTSLLLNSL